MVNSSNLLLLSVFFIFSIFRKLLIIMLYKLCDSPTSSKETQRMIEENKESYCITVVFFVFYSCVIVLLFSLFYGLIA